MSILHVHVAPNAKVDSVAGEYGGEFKNKLRAAAVKGKANAALIRFLAEQLKLPPAYHRVGTRSEISRQTDAHKWVAGGRGAQTVPRATFDTMKYSPQFRSSKASQTRVRLRKLLRLKFSRCRLSFATTFEMRRAPHRINIASRPVYLPQRLRDLRDGVACGGRVL